MQVSSAEYTRVFKQLCHMVALSKGGKLKPAVDNLVVTVLGHHRGKSKIRTGIKGERMRCSSDHVAGSQ